jgi:hypothetical protein
MIIYVIPECPRTPVTYLCILPCRLAGDPESHRERDAKIHCPCYSLSNSDSATSASLLCHELFDSARSAPPSARNTSSDVHGAPHPYLFQVLLKYHFHGGFLDYPPVPPNLFPVVLTFLCVYVCKRERERERKNVVAVSTRMYAP